MHIAIGGFHIESCTFSPLVTREQDFIVLRGTNLLKTYGFLHKFHDVDFVPLVRARALPGGPVTRSFYEKIKAEFLHGIQEEGPWDGVFLHMHGAVNVIGMEDAEGDWIAAIREITGPDCLIAASYDLHGNVTHKIMDNLDILSAYRTAPHIDWYETLERTCTLLVQCIKTQTRPYKAFIQVPVLLPGEKTSTEYEPAAGLYRQIPQIVAQDGVLDASILVGYAWADEARATASVVALGTDKSATTKAAQTLAQSYWDARRGFQFGVPSGTVDECIAQALNTPECPVVISDSGDNPTAGGAGDIPYVLERLLAHNVPDAVYASITDPGAVERCAEASIGQEVTLSLGGKLDPINGQPLNVKGKILTLQVQPWGLQNKGEHQKTNKIAVVQVNDIQVIITERRTAFHHRADFERLNIQPQQHKIVVVKIGYLVPELQEMAAKALLALSPGAVNQAIEQLPFKHIQRPMYPFNPDMDWEPPEL